MKIEVGMSQEASPQLENSGLYKEQSSLNAQLFSYTLDVIEFICTRIHTQSVSCQVTSCSENT